MRRLQTVPICILTITLLAGCEATTRYKVSNFFFDGVPNPEQVSVEGAGKDKTTLEKTTETAMARRKYRDHGPFAAKMCEACHQRGSNTLILPIEQLCFKCHTLNSGKKYIHGPVTSGSCRSCHDVHGSGHSYLLVSESKDFCFYCHDRNALINRDVHKGNDTECTACHDAHSADNRYLLK